MRMCGVALVGVAVVLGLSGCVSAEPQVSESSESSGDAGESRMPLLSADPGMQRSGFSEAILFEQVDVGAHEYSLPPLSDSVDQLFLAIGCDRTSEFELFLVSDGEVVDGVQANDCASERGTAAMTSITEPFDADPSTLKLRVTVDDGVWFSVSVFEAGGTTG
ncbi:hypothetical protein I6E81_03760 [Salinibacterium sp. NG22]|uniref:hypothetical protein n=1 Tax=Salinibacterium sp. NG22 TaxID=2792040 RepID=UPI0018CF85ED|nr:hypothetical protein [Salinibacterium sp. NG22]MBH0109273.1 hypothetical protein [Salinibacterium sp. NG22]